VTVTEALTPISVVIPVKNEARNIQRCLEELSGWASEIVVVDSQSQDGTEVAAKSLGARVVQFHYKDGWPKKRQWALSTLEFKNEWILLLDADEILGDSIKREIAVALQAPGYDGYWLRYRIVFLGRQLRWGGTELWKLSLFRRGKGSFEVRLLDQDSSMGDIEVHEHVVVDGTVGRLKHPVRHENVNSLDRYIEKHNQYSNWEARVQVGPKTGAITGRLFGNQAERRRHLKRLFLNVPGSPLWFFLFKYVCQLGCLDGIAGLTYAAFQSIQVFHVKAKIYEWQLRYAK